MVLYRMAKNEGKIFEESFVSSVDKSHVLVKRLNDNAASWSGGNASRFASKNECDFIFYEMNERIFMGLELKSTKNSLTFWREDFEIKGVKQSFNIKKNQILGLSRWSEYNGTICGLVINFREFNNKTFFIEIKDFLKYTDKLNKKSINIDDVLKMDHIEIKSQLKRTKYKYDIEKFICDALKEVKG